MKNENEKPFAHRLSEKLRKNVYREYSDTGTFDDKFMEGKQRLFSLLADHPYFIEGVSKLRKKYKLPIDGFQDTQEAYNWEHRHKDKNVKHYFIKDVDNFISEFEIPNVYRQVVWAFVYDFIISPQHPSWIERTPLFSIVETNTDREINKFLVNPDSTYIEVFEWTTGRDVVKALKKLNKNKNVKLPFAVSKVEGIAKLVWKLTTERLKDEAIKDEVNKWLRAMGKKRIFGYADVPVYRKRYKDALSAIRKLE